MRAVRTKKRCCKSGKRCKRCPVVMKRLEKDGYAERVSKRNYLVLEVVPKKRLRAARQR
ncbi:MAG: hypothetical protein H0T15_04275 [Thermoleophilaceae bacterium]|nr:hypothetical protein [Thermoleophilaceae bacterium]